MVDNYSHHSDKDLIHMAVYTHKPDKVLYSELLNRVKHGALNYDLTLDFFIYYEDSFVSIYHDLHPIFESCVQAHISASKLGTIIDICSDLLWKTDFVSPRIHEIIRAGLLALDDAPEKYSLCCSYLCFNIPTFSDPVYSQVLFFAAKTQDPSLTKRLFSNITSFQKTGEYPKNLENDYYPYPALSPEKKVDYLLGLIWYYKAIINYHRINGLKGKFSKWAKEQDFFLGKLELLHLQKGKDFVFIPVPDSKIIL